MRGGVRVDLSVQESADQMLGEGKKLVVIGNGMAGCRAVSEVLAREDERDAARYSITIFGAEPRVNYNRIMLSPVLAGEMRFDDIIINSQGWYDENNIALITGDPVTEIDRTAKTVTSQSGRVEAYDTLIIATGSDPFIIPIPGHDLDGVVTFRDLDDVEAMVGAADKGGSAVVIGGGLLGLEAAHGLSLRGMTTTIIHLGPDLMDRQLDPEASGLLKTELERRGQRVLTSANSSIIHGENGKITALELDDGTRIAADLLVMSAGVRPNISLAKEAGLDCERGIVVDDNLVTSDPNVLAVGECVQHRGLCYGLVAPLWDMAGALANTLAGTPVPYQGSVTSTKLKVSGIDVFSAGDFSAGDDVEEIVLRDPSQGSYKRLTIREGRLIGAVLYGDVADGGWYFDLLQGGADISAMRDGLIFGPAFVDLDEAA